MYHVEGLGTRGGGGGGAALVSWRERDGGCDALGKGDFKGVKT